MDFSFQLYSGRNFPPLDALMGRVAAIGYTQVEGYGGLYDDIPGLATSLKKHGLKMPTSHFSLAQVEDTSRAMKTAEALGISLIICPWIPPEARGTDASVWRALSDKLARLGEIYRKAGFGFGWHNHDFEFQRTTSGELPMDILMGASSDNIWEMDVAWLVRGGQDPVPWLDKYGKRIAAVHLKDLARPGEAEDEGGWADVGHGRMDWPKLFSTIRAKTAAKYYVMEHDNPTDVDRFARRALASARSWN